MTAGGDLLDEIERELVARGLPHFVERRASAWDIWARAIPLLVVGYLLLGLNALDLSRWSWRQNLLAAACVIATLVGAWVVANLVRGRGALERPVAVGPVELALLVIAPSVPSAMLGQWGDVGQTIAEGVGMLVAVWLLTSYGVVPLLGWAARRTASQLLVFFNVVVRALPLLLLFETFLFINAEVWQVAGTLTGASYVLVLAMFVLLGTLFLLSRVPPLLQRLNRFEQWEEIAALADVAGAPGACAGLDGTSPPGPDRLSFRQRFNVGLVALFPQALQIAAASVSVTGFFIVFGVLAIPEVTAAAWTGLADVRTFATVRLDGRSLALTEPLVRVAGFLGAFTGMYFTVLLSTDSAYREEFAQDIGPELRRALAMRRLYRALLGRPEWGRVDERVEG